MKWNSRPLILAALGTFLTAMSAMAQNAPVADDQNQATFEDTAKAIPLSATDPDGDPLTYEVVSLPTYGTLTGTPPNLTYQPMADFNGPDSFTFLANDGIADSNIATVDISVSAVNDAPTGTVKINAEKVPEGVTRSTSVLLTLTAADDGVGPIQMCISNTAWPCSAWTAFTESPTTKTMTRSWTLPGGSGTKTVNVWFQDQWGNTTPTSTPTSTTILLDTTAPGNGKVAVVQGNMKLTLNWSEFEDNTPGSGITGYRAVFRKGASAPSSCTVGTPVPGYAGSNNLSATLEHTVVLVNGTSLVNGTTYAYRVCAIDLAGNMSSGATVTGKPVPETNPPTGTVRINVVDGVEQVATKSTLATLTLKLNPGDPGDGAIQMCISNTNTKPCYIWTAFAELKSWTLPAVSGPKTVYVWFRDRWGNTSTAPVSDTVLLDTTAPVNGEVTAVQGDTKLTLNWSEFEDNTSGSGITGYRAVFRKGARAPSSCTAGTPVPGYAGSNNLSTTLEHTVVDGKPLVNGTTYAYRVCAIDAANNISSGSTVTGKPVSTNCAGCHNGNPDYPLAPNVMTYWAGSASGQDGGHGDPGGFAAVACTACHDVNLPSGPDTARHGTGVYNSIWANDSTRSTNTAHLKAEFFTKYPAVGAGDWSIQVAMDNYCTYECHDLNRNDVQDAGESVRPMRHEVDTLPTAADHHSMKFGTHMTPPTPPNANPDTLVGIPIDIDLNTGAAGGGNYAVCVSCHDPHGTGTVTSHNYPSNLMLRFGFPPDSSLLCSKCHR